MTKARSVLGTALAAALVCACSFAGGRQAADLPLVLAPQGPERPEPAIAASKKPLPPRVAPRAPAGANVAFQPPPAYVAKAYLGSLRVSVTWPADQSDATVSFKTQAVPFSTNALIIRVFGPGATTPIVPLAVVVRPDGGGRSEALIDGIPAGNNYSVDIEAFRERDPLVASPTLVARGASSVNILPSVVSPADIELVPSFVPIIKAVSSTLATPGDILTITGQNFGAIGSLAPIVTFNGTAASISVSATPINAGTIQVQVPQGAAVGRFAVSNDGIPFVSNSVVWIPARVAIRAPVQQWQGRNLNPGQLYYGTSLRFEASWAWALSPGATESLYGVAPAPVWASSAPKADPRTGQPVNAIDQVGEFRAAAVHTLTDVTARLGSLVSNKITIEPVGVDKIEVNPALVELNAGTEDGSSPDAGYVTTATVSCRVTSTLPFFSDVVWKTTDGSRLGAGRIGQVQSLPDFVYEVEGRIDAKARAGAGVVFVTVDAVDDARLSATSSVTLTDIGGIGLEVD
jgi:hypothetical protein